jgi:serine protease Do
MRQTGPNVNERMGGKHKLDSWPFPKLSPNGHRRPDRAEDAMKLPRRFLLACGSFALLWSGNFSVSAQEASRTNLIQPAAPAIDRSLDFGGFTRTGARRTKVVEAVDRVKNAVVNIHSERNVAAAAESYSGGATYSRVNGMGTGIVVDPRGYIVTNQHVIDDVNLLRIRLADGSSHGATIFARSPETDLAIIKINAGQPLPMIPIGTASDLMVGETVLAVGNAYGYEHTVSLGIVSAIKRDVSLNKELQYKSLIQTDASINPGNSGGPLVNIHGDLVGVNVAIRAGAQGIGFAIPADNMIRTVSDLFRLRRRSATFDGMVLRDHVDTSHEIAVRWVAVDRVETDSPAAKAGLQIGDKIAQVGDVKVRTSIDVERAFLDSKAGDNFSIVVRRDDREQRVDFVMGGPDHRALRPAANIDVVWRKLGMQLVPIANDAVAKVNRQLNGGLEVTAIQDEGVAAKAGIRKGDILVGLHQWETLTVDNVQYVLTHPELPTFSPLSFYILRQGQVRRGYLANMN